MKQLFFTLLLVSIILYSNAQNADHTNYYKEVPVILKDNYSVKFSDVVAKAVYCKMAIEIENKTSDYMIYKEQETGFIYPHGEFHPKKKSNILDPNSSKKRTLDVSDDNRFHVDTFTLDFRGLYLIPIKGQTMSAADFTIPTSINEFDAGPFHVKCTKVKQETDETKVQFACTYTGDKIGLVNPAKLSVKIASGQEFANDDKKASIEVLEKGDEIKFNAVFHIPGKIVDMQFATMEIIWNDTFVESTPKAADPELIEFQIDPGLTQGKNK